MNASRSWSQLLHFVLGSALVLQLTGCPKAGTPSCPTGEKACTTGEECESAICGASQCCVPKSTAATGCMTSDDCATGETCSDGGCSSMPSNNGCQTDTDCSATAATPHCDTDNGSCVACRTAADCSVANQTCNSANTCVFMSGFCATNTDCAGIAGTPVCDTVLGQCVGCTMDSDCTPATCNIETETCNAVVDAGPMETDAGQTEDAGHADAGRHRDAGQEVDAGEDAGVEVDAGHEVDAGPEVDAGHPVDAGHEVDAGVDAGVANTDAGTTGTDAGMMIVDAGSGADAGPCTRTIDCPAGQICNSGTCEAATACTSASSCSGSTPYCNPITSHCAECQTTAECASGEVCYGGICVTASACTGDSTCATGDACVPLSNPNWTGWELQCIPENPGAGLGGAACSSDEGCLSGYCLLIYSPTDGICMDACTTTADCATGAECPPKGVIFQLLPGPSGTYDNANEVSETENVCMPETCTADSQCASAGAGGVPRACLALVGTTTGGTNPSTQTDTALVEICMPATNPTVLKGDAPCTSDAECFSGNCFNWGFDTECFTACTSASQCPNSDLGECASVGLKNESGVTVKACE